MLQEEQISFAIKGAITKFQGFGDYIASSSSFEKSPEDIKAISEMDRDLTAFYDRQPIQYSELIQYFFFPKSIAGRNCFLAIRAKKKFTAFPEQYRFYDRREYYYLKLNSEIDTIEFSFSLPEMSQYDSKQLGQTGSFKIKRINSEVDEKFAKNIVLYILTESTLLIKITEQNHFDIQSKILGCLYMLPTCYKKYFGFGFNIKSDSVFVKDYLHIITTLDENAIEIGSSFPQRLHDNDLDEFSKSILGGLIKYDDTEIKLLNAPLNRNTLFELLKYHKLHFRIDKYSSASLGEAKKQELFSESENYIATFLTSEFSGDTYIQKRIVSIYKFWHNNSLLNTDIFLSFWKKVGEANLKYERLSNDYEIKDSINTFIQIECRSVKTLRDADNKYYSFSKFPSFNYSDISLLDEIKIEFYKQKKSDTALSIAEINELDIYINGIAKKTEINFQENLFRNVDFKKQSQSLSNQEGFELLKEKIEKFTPSQIEEIITVIGLTYLFQILQNGTHQKLLGNIEFKEPVLGLVIRQGDLNQILKWILLFQENNVKSNFDTGGYLADQSIKINSQNDFFLFDSLSKSIINNKSLFREADVLSFIEKIVGKKDCQTLQFYSTAFNVADSFNFKINVWVPSINGESELIDFISLLEEKHNCISNNKIINELKEEFFNSFLQRKESFGEVLQFSNENALFVSANTNQISEKLEELYTHGSDYKKYLNTLTLFNNIIDNKRNLFLNSNSTLYKCVSKLEIIDRDSIRELYHIGMLIDKRKNIEFIEVKNLINQQIDKYFETINQNEKFFTRMKNKISFIKTKAKVLIVCLIVSLVGTLTAATYYLIQNNLLSRTAHKVYQENRSLKTKNQELEAQLSATIERTKSNPVLIASTLSPLPNNELNDKDVGVVNKNIKRGMTVMEVVEVIFTNNPGDIDSHYNQQKTTYAVELVKSNSTCFENNQYLGEPLIHIPSYK